MEMLKELRNCEMHMTHIPTPGDEAGLRKLGVNLTSDPGYSSSDLFFSGFNKGGPALFLDHPGVADLPFDGRILAQVDLDLDVVVADR